MGLAVGLWFLPFLPLGMLSPHLPQRLTWEVVAGAGDVIWSVTKIATPYTWWPDLFPDVCKLAFRAPANWDMEGYHDPDMPAPSVASLLR